MYQNLSPEDIEKVRELSEIRQRNNDFSWMLCDYLNRNPCLITKELMESVNDCADLSEETTYCALLTGFCGLDIENNEQDKLFTNEYFRRAVKKLNSEAYLDNPYYQNIKIPKVTFGNWELTYQKYKPYEAFIYKDLVTDADFKEFPCLGFFNEEFLFPSVMEKAHEWMSIKPSELETLQSAIDVIEGNVITFGLGLGYFAFMASIKKDVQSITIVERNKDVILLFEQYILPQFEYQEKVEIICTDAFDFVENQMPERQFDYAFVDLWHDVSDGLDLYLKMKKLEHLNEQTKFLYWIEDSLLSGFRWQLFDWIVTNVESYSEILKWLSKPFLQNLATTKLKIITEASE